MKNYKKYFLTLPVILILISCTDNPVNESVPKNLEGTWVYRSYENDVFTMEKSLGLENENSGLVILSNGNLIERKNVGWCGTPPVVYDNYQGSWKSLTDKTLNITVGYWGGTENYTMEIVSLTSSLLKFKKVMIK
jgi:hypothetical protein